MLQFQTGQASAFSRLSLIWNKIAPHRIQRKIDSQLYLHNTQIKKTPNPPKDIKKVYIDTPDGKIATYQTGAGPLVLFVHGWEGNAGYFFSQMLGLKACGFTAISFDHFGHGASDSKPATLQQLIKTTNYLMAHFKRRQKLTPFGIVAHGLGCVVTANLKPSLINNLQLFMISPVFNYKIYFLRKLSGLKLHPDVLKEYAEQFLKSYDFEYAPLELDRQLERYAANSLLAHDTNDLIAPITGSIQFTEKFPITKLMMTKTWDHNRIITSESVWQELKSHLHYEDTTINFSNILVNHDAYNPA